MDYRPK